MKLRYEIDGHEVIVNIHEQLVCITNDDAFKNAIASRPVHSVAFLINSLRADYARIYGSVLAIGDDSFAVEIWGHLYAEYCLLKYKTVLRFVFPFGLYNRFLRSCRVFDCGARGKDPNRWVWDILARYRHKIEGWLPKIGSWLASR
jgi:hypothetical protein